MADLHTKTTCTFYKSLICMQFTMCSIRKYPDSPHRRDWKFLGGGGSQRPQNLSKCMNLDWNFQKGGGLRKKPFHGERMDNFWNHTMWLPKCVYSDKTDWTQCVLLSFFALMFMPLTLHFQIYVSFCHSLCTSYASHECNSQGGYSRFQEMGIIKGFFGVEINFWFRDIFGYSKQSEDSW